MHLMQAAANPVVSRGTMSIREHKYRVHISWDTLDTYNSFLIMMQKLTNDINQYLNTNFS